MPRAELRRPLTNVHIYSSFVPLFARFFFSLVFPLVSFFSRKPRSSSQATIYQRETCAEPVFARRRFFDRIAARFRSYVAQKQRSKGAGGDRSKLQTLFCFLDCSPPLRNSFVNSDEFFSLPLSLGRGGSNCQIFFLSPSRDAIAIVGSICSAWWFGLGIYLYNYTI